MIRLAITGEGRRRGRRVPLRSAGRSPRGSRVVTPNEMPEECPEDNRAKGNEETEDLIDPVHDRRGKRKGMP